MGASSLALLARRVFETDYTEYTKKADYFNLAFFAVTLAVALAAHLGADPGFVALRTYVTRLVTFDFSSAGVGLSGLRSARRTAT